MTPLRQKMIRAMDLKNLSHHTRRAYLAAVNGLAKHYKQSPETITNEIYMKIFIETKGEMEGVISAGEVDWDLDAERALNRIAEMLPHFVRSIAIKKIHQVADDMAIEKNSSVTIKILQAVTHKYTPTRFKGKYATLFADMEEPLAEEPSPQPLKFIMEWDEDAKEMLQIVPEEYQIKAVEGTEDYARQHNHDRITVKIVKEYQNELGF